jgi:hypothetical protein
MDKRPLMYDPTAPFPPVGSPGEFGRAWLDSLYHSNPHQYKTLERSGRLVPLTREKEAEGQQMFASYLEARNPKERPLGMTPEQWIGASRLQARELAMADLRVPEPEEREEEPKEPEEMEESEEPEESPTRS